jgi:hypothetical protein
MRWLLSLLGVLFLSGDGRAEDSDCEMPAWMNGGFVSRVYEDVNEDGRKDRVTVTRQFSHGIDLKGPYSRVRTTSYVELGDDAVGDIGWGGCPWYIQKRDTVFHRPSPKKGSEKKFQNDPSVL